MTVAKLTTPNNIDICYEIFGEEHNAPPIVLISGAGLQMLGWPDEFCKMLAKRGHRVIRFDNRDTGESTNLKHLPAPAPWRVALMHKLGFRISPPYTLEDMANDLVHLLDGLGVQRAHLVGISLGGMIVHENRDAHKYITNSHNRAIFELFIAVGHVTSWTTKNMTTGSGLHS